MNSTLPVICAWCESSHEVPRELLQAVVADGRLSHGICGPCREKVESEMELRVESPNFARETRETRS